MIEFLPDEVSKTIRNMDLRLETRHSIPEIPDLLNHTLLLAGKRLRPALCFLMGRALGVSYEDMSVFARSAEFTHSASLAHDDVLDKATLRRNRRTLNDLTSNSRAVLAGDLLLARVMVELSEKGNLEIIRDLSSVVEDLVNGEWLQLEARENIDINQEYLLEVSKRKTASLMSWCCRAAARVSGKNDTRLLNACNDFGLSLGLAFQIIDDVIDFDRNGEKEFAKDLREGLVNFVTSEILLEHPELIGEFAAILGKKDFAQLPCTEEQLDSAINRVREKSTFYLHDAGENLAVIKEFVADDEEALNCYETLNSLLGFLEIREV